ACSIHGVLPHFPTSKSPGLSSLISVADDEVLLNTNLPPEHDVRAAAFGLGQRLVLLGGLLAGLRPGTAATTADVLRPAGSAGRPGQEWIGRADPWACCITARSASGGLSTSGPNISRISWIR